MRFSRATIVYGGSVLLHAGVAFALVRIEPEPLHEATSVTVVEVKKAKQEPKKAEPPPPPPVQVVQPSAPKIRKPAAPKPAPVAEAPAPAPASEAPSAGATPPPMFGLTLSGGVGTGGIAVPQGNSLAAPQGPRVTRTAQPKALVAKKEREEGPASDTECLDALVKPKPIAIPQPAYADRAREAGIEGKVRVELTVDETGAVVETRVLEGLGYGLDEAALEAARASRFEPALKCGKPTRTTFVIGIRFAL